MSSTCVERLPLFELQNDSKGAHEVHKNVKLLKCLDSFGVTLKRFWSKTRQRSFQTMCCKARSFVVDCVGISNEIFRKL